MLKADIIKNIKMQKHIVYSVYQTKNLTFLGLTNYLLNCDISMRKSMKSKKKATDDFNQMKFVSLGLDGCSTMTGKDSSVKAILHKKYSKALFSN